MFITIISYILLIYLFTPVSKVREFEMLFLSFIFANLYTYSGFKV